MPSPKKLIAPASLKISNHSSVSGQLGHLANVGIARGRGQERSPKAQQGTGVEEPRPKAGIQLLRWLHSSKYRITSVNAPDAKSLDTRLHMVVELSDHSF